LEREVTRERANHLSFLLEKWKHSHKSVDDKGDDDVCDYLHSKEKEDHEVHPRPFASHVYLAA
jgi:hypothetical protein